MAGRSRALFASRNGTNATRFGHFPQPFPRQGLSIKKKCKLESGLYQRDEDPREFSNKKVPMSPRGKSLSGGVAERTFRRAGGAESETTPERTPERGAECHGSGGVFFWTRGIGNVSKCLFFFSRKLFCLLITSHCTHAPARTSPCLKQAGSLLACVCTPGFPLAIDRDERYCSVPALLCFCCL